MENRFKNIIISSTGYVIAAILAIILLPGILILTLYRNIRKSEKKIPQKIMKGGEPFFYKRGKTGMLLIHGFTSTPQELRYLAKYLADKNISVMAPLMKGHGRSPEAMLETNSKDWIDSAEKAYLELKKHCNTIT